MGKSLTRKIIEAHYVSGSMKAGEEVFIKVDQTLTHDINAVMTYLAFEAIGLDRIRTECSVSYLDHNLLYVDHKTPEEVKESLHVLMTIFTYSLQLSISVFMFPDLETVSVMQSRYHASALLER